MIKKEQDDAEMCCPAFSLRRILQAAVRDARIQSSGRIFNRDACILPGKVHGKDKNIWYHIEKLFYKTKREVYGAENF